MRTPIALALLLCVTAGCPESPPESSIGEEGISAADTAKYRLQFFTEDEPAEAQTVIEVRDHLASASSLESETPPPNVVVVGVVGGGMPNPYGKQGSVDFPWFPKMAAFALVDPTTAEQFADTDHQHTDGQECIFCTNKAQGLVDTVATVTLQDESGQVIPERADELLGLENGATVVVEGQGRLELGALKVIAERIYVRP